MALTGGYFPVELKFAGWDVLIIEGKAEIKKRLGRSPDHGDAVMMSLFCNNQGERRRGGRGGRGVKVLMGRRKPVRKK